MLPPPMKAMRGGEETAETGEGIALGEVGTCKFVDGKNSSRLRDRIVFERLEMFCVRSPVLSSPFSPLPLAKQRRADPHQRRAFLDGDFEIVGHAEG